MADLAALSRRWFEEVWNQRREATIDELFAPDGIAHGLSDGQKKLPGPVAFRGFWKRFLNAFPDLRIEIDDVITQGDKTALRFHFTGTHRGADLGLTPTGKQVNVTGMSIIRWRDGQIVDGWNEFDVMSLMQQLGAAPQSSPRGSA